MSKVWGQYRAEGVQVYPGGALLGGNGSFTRVALWRFRRVPDAGANAVVAGLQRLYAGRPETVQLRVFRVPGDDPRRLHCAGRAPRRAACARPRRAGGGGPPCGSPQCLRALRPPGAGSIPDNEVARRPDDAIWNPLRSLPVAPRDALTWLDVTVDTVVGVALLGELIVVIANVMGRWLLDTPLLWADEVAGFSLAIIAFLGGAIAYRREQHVLVRTLVDMLPTRWRLGSYALVDWLVLEIALIAGYESLGLLVFRWEEITPILEMRASWIAMPLTVSMLVLAVYAVARLYRQPRAAVIWSGLALVVITALIVGVRHGLGHSLPSNASVSVAIAAVLVTVLAGLPIAFALMLGTVLFLYMGGLVAMVALPQNMVDGTGRFVLLALPFFIFAGIVMERGGISRRLIAFVAALVGGLRGGLLQVMVVSMYIVSGISGSKAADVAAVGLVMRDMLNKEKYDVDQSAALLAASAAMGECIPPSLAMLVLGSVTSLSVAALFAAGLIPAAVIAAILMLLIWVQSPRRAGSGLSFGGISRLGLGALIPFSMPVLLFAGILLGFADADGSLRICRGVRIAHCRAGLSRNEARRFPADGGRGGHVVRDGSLHARRRAIVLVGIVGGGVAAPACGTRHRLRDRGRRSS